MLIKESWKLYFWSTRGERSQSSSGFYKLNYKQTYACGDGYNVYGVIIPIVKVGIRIEQRVYFDKSRKTA